MQESNSKRAEKYQWSFCRTHLNLVKEPLVKAKPLSAYIDKWEEYVDKWEEYVDKWEDFINLKVEPNESDALQKHEGSLGLEAR